MINLKALAFLCSAAVLAACSQPEPMMQVSAEPVYNKMGDVVGCTDGRTYLPGTAPMENPCAPPSEDCKPLTIGGATPPGCPEPTREDTTSSDTRKY